MAVNVVKIGVKPRMVPASNMKKGGTSKVAGAMKSGGAAKSVKPAKKYQSGGGISDQFKKLTETLKNKPAGSTQEQLDYKEILRMRNKGALESGWDRSPILNPKGYKRVLELEKKMQENDKKFKPASKKTGGSIKKKK